MTNIIGYDSWKLQNPSHYDSEDAPENCVVCSEPHNPEADIFCNCHCSECGDELPEADDSHCTNCCQCDACIEAYDAIEKHHEKTGEWKDMPVITGEKVFSQ